MAGNERALEIRRAVLGAEHPDVAVTLNDMAVMLVREGEHANAEPLSTRTIDSGGPAKAVLEINGGAARMLGIKPGDIVRHQMFNNVK